jgi:hypothetical protein
MDKLRESKLFEYVYGHCKDWSVKTHESPDFVCSRNNTPILGVEVTELYHNETDARLKNLDGYGLSLLGDGDFRHKQDKKNIRVELIKYFKKGDTKGREIKAIIQEPPSLAQSISILGNTIKTKESKIVTYLQVCPEVDLVIDDASYLLRFDKYEDLFRPLSKLMNRLTIVNSRFREIFLIIKNNQNMIVRIPLKLNLFVEDVMIFEHLIRALKESRSTKDSFLILLCCLCQSGYKDIRIKSIDGGIGLVVGNYLYLYSKTGKVIRDYTTIPEQAPKGELISETIRNAGEIQRQVTNTLVKERSDFKCCAPLFFEVK